ncbi:hypothetical protein FQZ97_1128730 [compost metagenome]
MFVHFGGFQLQAQQELVDRLRAHHQNRDLGVLFEGLGVHQQVALAIGLQPQLATFETDGDTGAMGFTAFAVGVFEDQRETFGHGSSQLRWKG